MSSSTQGSSRASRVGTIVIVMVLAAVAVVYREPLAGWLAIKNDDSAPPNAQSPAAKHDHAAGSASAIDHYTCSMHPSVNQPGPGKCPICGMNLTPVTKQQQTDGVVMIDETRRQLIGVKTAPVTQGPMQRKFQAVGRVTYDESSFTDVSLKVSGWITKLTVNETGQRVVRGQTLFMLYSPELYTAQQDFLSALRSASAIASASASPAATAQPPLVRAARKRLSLLGLSDRQIGDLEAKGEPVDTIPIASPASGFVIEKDVVEGAAVQSAMRLLRIADLNRVWVEVDVYAADLPQVRVGQPAVVTLDYLPGHALSATVSYVYPALEPSARTGRVRVELANKQLDLRPGMFARVELASPLGTRIQVPASAVVYTGPRRLVFLDLGEGRFKPQEVRTGIEGDGMFEVLDGLKPGDVVATSGMFLIAAEARISTAAKYWDSDAQAPVASAPALPAADVTPLAPPPTAPPKAKRAPSKPEPSKPEPSALYTCPMHPDVHSDAPGDCPQCGMPLVPVAGGTAP